LTDECLQERFDHAALASLAVKGGADTVQYREKRRRTTAQRVATARGMLAAMAGAGVLIVDDRADVALAACADGVHLGRDDLNPATARAILGPGRLVGGTAHSLDEALLAAANGVDYLGVGPVFGTQSKANPAPPLRLPDLARITKAVTVPVIAIGNITSERVGEVLQAGAYGVAVLSSVVCTRDPRAAAERMREALDLVSGQERGERGDGGRRQR
jgi:thiamine-phosphate pyrophosphorylase